MHKHGEMGGRFCCELCGGSTILAGNFLRLTASFTLVYRVKFCPFEGIKFFAPFLAGVEKKSWSDCLLDGQ